MKRHATNMGFNGLVIGLLLAGFSGSAWASDVCSRGLGQPPFLSFGVNSNLLMMLDNSGSMLDMAYVDTDTDGAGADRATQCFDEGFVAYDSSAAEPSVYAGNFTVLDATGEVWYKRVEPEVEPWRSGKAYAQNSLVTFAGTTFRAYGAGTSTGTVIAEDNSPTSPKWESVLRPLWHNNTWYHRGSFIFTDTLQVFRATADGTSNGTAITSDLGVPWVEVERWQNAINYPAGTYVLGKDLQLFYTINGGLSNGTKPTNDQGAEWVPADFHQWKTNTNYKQYAIVTHNSMIYYKQAAGTHLSSGSIIYDDDFSANWHRIDEGYFEAVTEADALAACQAAPRVAYYRSADVCVAVNNTGAGTSNYISAFAASGNFLNWAMASKFDIQKDILTGGKFNDEEQRLISENRGCAGNRFIKQVAVQQVFPAAAAMHLTMSVRMPGAEDRVDWADDTTRFEIYAITTNGIDFEACQDAIEAFQDPGGLGPAEQDIAECVGWENTPQGPVEHIVYHKAIQECWFYAKHGTWKGGNDHPLMTCPQVYVNESPTSIDPGNPAYVCWGIYDPGPHDQREGFVGRCWERTLTPPPVGETCLRKACTCAAYPCYYEQGGTWRRCESDQVEDYCPGTYNSSKKECKVGNDKNAWADVYWDTSLAGPPYPEGCTPAVLPPPGYDYWSMNLDGIAGNIAPEPDADDVAEVCVNQAMHDFCLQAEVPEVIDPTDEATETSDYWNLPAILVDSALFGNLGENPLGVMKGHINQPARPTGILHSTAGSLRIGAMAFNNNGAGTECGDVAVPPQIDQYCPRTNQDGAKVITPIRLGSLLTDDVNSNNSYDEAEDTRHLDNLVTAINAVRATSWTPLAEAMYNAIGYYTQNKEVRINETDFQTDADVIAGWLPNHPYAPGSYVLDNDILYQTVLGGLSTGGTLATDTGVVWAPLATYESAGWSNGTTYPAKTIIQDGGKLYISYGGGTAEQKGGSPGGPLYDMGMTWEPFIDPVAHWCQENHILVITEGASTADIDASVASFVQGAHAFNLIPIEDPGEAVADQSATQCTDGLQGSTYLDDLTYFAWNHDDPDDKESANLYTLYPAGNQTIPAGDLPYADMEKRTIQTHVVVAGALRDDGGATECNPSRLMKATAYNGGTSAPLSGEKPQELEENLLSIFNSLAQRASAGSAASVISSARGGEGAIYQAIFWPELKRDNPAGDDIIVSWAGDVHGLFLDNRGYMYEDTNGDRTLTPYEDLDGDGNFDVEEARGEDIDGDGHYDCVNEDVDGDGNLDVNEKDPPHGNGDTTLDPGEDIDGDGNLDTVDEDLDGDGYLDTGEDTNHNGVLDPGEDINKDYILQLTEDLDGEGCDPASFDPFVDVDGDGHRDVNEDLNGNGVFDIDPTLDHRVIIYYDDVRGRSMACYNTSIFNNGVCDAAATKEMHEVKYLWSANEWLSGINSLNIVNNRNTYLSNEQKRFMFTWNDLDNDGIVDDSVIDTNGELLALESSVNWAGLGVDASRGSVVNDFDVGTDAELDMIVNWLRGADWLTDETASGVDANGNGRLDPPQRSRQIPDADNSATEITWRLGDIIHSTPMTVAAPAEGYHLIYNDFTYAQFLNKYKRRRHVVYFGGNDGFLHAVNAGFYNEQQKKFCLSSDLNASGLCDESTPPAAGFPALGTELWAYLPYNLQPHVKCLTDPEYTHKYFVDQRPRIFDAQIFPEEAACRTAGGDADFSNAGCIHPNGWGTILVNGLRFGGTRIRASELNGNGADMREFISSYFILDITNPENPPVLLGELSRERGGGDVNLGYSSMIPTMVIMKKEDANPLLKVNKWYLLLGSGPRDIYGAVPAKAIKGISDDNAKIAVLPLEWLTGKDTGTKTGLRIPDALPVSSESGGRWELWSSPNGFISDAITVDFDINPSYRDYKADAVYFGTVQGDFATSWAGTTYWSGGGLMYRLVTKNIVGGMSPIGRYTTENVTNPSQWQIKPLIDLRPPYNQPITASASVGTDGYNFWVYFGTGRFFDADDKTDAVQQTYYGIKEPMVSIDIDHDSDPATTAVKGSALTWEQVERTGVSTNAPGGRGLQNVSDILVRESPTIRTADLSCRGAAAGDYSCLPGSLQSSDYATLYYLDRYIAGQGNCATDPKNNCVDGWYKHFHPYNNREKNVGQATLLGGLVTFTTYQPFNDVCQAEGNAYLYGVYYRTGTAWHENIFGSPNGLNGDNVADKLNLGRGLATTPNLHVGSGSGDKDQGPKAFVQTSTGEIKEIEQENLPIKNYRTGRSLWKEFSK